MNTNVVRAPLARKTSLTRDVLLIAWILFFVASGTFMTGLLLHQISQPEPMGLIIWICMPITVISVAGSWILLPGTFRRELARYRQRFPVQSLEQGQWKTLPFLRWEPLLFSSYTVSMTFGFILGLIFGAMKLFVGN